MPGQDEYFSRRMLLQIVSVGALAGAAAEAQSPCASKPATAAAAPYKLQFFTPSEAELIETVMEKIIPADDHSPGAKEAKVIEFCDLMIATGPAQGREDWRTGMELLARELKTTSLDEWLESASRNEGDPQTVLDLFYHSIKDMTVSGYYTSSTGIHQDLNYQGNTYVAKFVGCDHPEHQS